jgi:hypothetical protein
MFDATAPRFGLPASLWIPIAAASVADIEAYVGPVVQRITNPRDGIVNAVLVESVSRGALEESHIPLWGSLLADRARERLHPRKQVWVHVDYDGYREAYVNFGMPAIPQNYFLDHVQNRKAIGNPSGRDLRPGEKSEVSHPYLRLCPVHRRVNTSGGHKSGGEGMEKEFLAKHPHLERKNRIIYADPMDLTKMLDIQPGTKILEGVRETQQLFYP